MGTLPPALSLARLAAPSPGVEAEARGSIAAELCLAGGREDLADRVEDPGKGCRGGPGAAADRTLIDLDQRFDGVQALDGGRARAGRTVTQSVVTVFPGQHIMDERALARPAHAGDAGQRAERDPRFERLEVVFRSVVDNDPAGHGFQSIPGAG